MAGAGEFLLLEGEGSQNRGLEDWGRVSGTCHFSLQDTGRYMKMEQARGGRDTADVQCRPAGVRQEQVQFLFFFSCLHFYLNK